MTTPSLPFCCRDYCDWKGEWQQKLPAVSHTHPIHALNHRRRGLDLGHDLDCLIDPITKKLKNRFHSSSYISRISSQTRLFQPTLRWYCHQQWTNYNMKLVCFASSLPPWQMGQELRGHSHALLRPSAACEASIFARKLSSEDCVANSVWNLPRILETTVCFRPI